MKSARATRSTYVAAFLLGSLVGLLLAAPARGATPVPLGPTVFSVFDIAYTVAAA